jgi:hypothetical protein
VRNQLRETSSVRSSPPVRLLAALGATLLAACSDSAEVRIPAPPQGAEILQRYVALGNSLTAGFQSGGINDSTQLEAYPAIVAEQAGTDYNVVLIPKLTAGGAPSPARRRS